MEPETKVKWYFYSIRRNSHGISETGLEALLPAPASLVYVYIPVIMQFSVPATFPYLWK